MTFIKGTTFTVKELPLVIAPVKDKKKKFGYIDLFIAFLFGTLPIMLWHLWTQINNF